MKNHILKTTILVLLTSVFSIGCCPDTKPVKPNPKDYMKLPAVKIYLLEKETYAIWHDPERHGDVKFISGVLRAEKKILIIEKSYVKNLPEGYILDDETMYVDIEEMKHWSNSKKYNEEVNLWNAEMDWRQAADWWDKCHPENLVEGLPENMLDIKPVKL